MSGYRAWPHMLSGGSYIFKYGWYYLMMMIRVVRKLPLHNILRVFFFLKPPFPSFIRLCFHNASFLPPDKLKRHVNDCHKALRGSSMGEDMKEVTVYDPKYSQIIQLKDNNRNLPTYCIDSSQGHNG